MTELRVVAMETMAYLGRMQKFFPQGTFEKICRA